MPIPPLGNDRITPASNAGELAPADDPAPGPAPAAPGESGPPADVEAHRNALDRMGFESSIRATKSHVVWLDGELGRLEANNRQLYESSQRTIQQMQNELVAVMTDRRVHNDDRVSAFFGIAQNSDRSRRLAQAWQAHTAKQAELGATLNALKATERELAGDGAESLDARLVLFQRRVRGLEELLANLERQAALLKEMVAQASNTGRALEAVQRALDASLNETRAWIARARGEATEDLLARLLDVAGFTSLLVLPPAAFAAMGPLLGMLRDLAAGDREPLENFVWRTLGRLATSALVEAGVGELAARAIVTALREGARAAIEDPRAEVRAAAGGAVLSEAQALVIDFLAREAAPDLPLGAIARAVVGLADLSRAEATRIVASLSHAGQGVDAALATLEAAVRAAPR